MRTLAIYHLSLCARCAQGRCALDLAAISTAPITVQYAGACWPVDLSDVAQHLGPSAALTGIYDLVYTVEDILGLHLVPSSIDVPLSNSRRRPVGLGGAPILFGMVFGGQCSEARTVITASCGLPIGGRREQRLRRAPDCILAVAAPSSRDEPLCLHARMQHSRLRAVASCRCQSRQDPASESGISRGVSFPRRTSESLRGR